ncbi:GntR family transcriptional regulator / MocR family aminotransferase [Actinacidiphila yanglinensis]|uniref:GntR family transcriptional regulator / MocR family aminotransferase n=1 Tax=Actinacidiphila yanglinensis TaxID=310779 RepID=A0A1H6CDA5_9ACTN|nr:PLP-dependent aminotransferase family protein [Actinacidiphila yanglinensis]SEG70842.1 GntR family transcriptional regulator / MocR family aminotransferase [Actinacidiphila yanglinensis]
MESWGTTSGAGGAATPASHAAAGATAAWEVPTAAWEVLLPSLDVARRGRGRALQSALREEVRSGRLAAGVRMPSSRALAADLGVSRGVVTDAYEQLTAEGYLTGRRGSGTWVARTAAGPAVPAVSGFATDDRGGPADLRPGLPDLSLFPRAAWSAAHRRIVAQLPHRAFGYPDPRGLPELRQALAELLVRRRCVAAEPDQVMVVSGVAQAHTLLGMVLHARGERAVAVEDPGSPEHHALLAAVGLSAVPVPVGPDGLRVDALAASGVRSVIATPSHQFPSGVAYSASRRAELAAWARSVDGLVIEDDYDGDFRYDRAPVGALQGLAPGHVAYTGSVSKSLAPGLRLGWLVAPADVVEEAAARKRTMDLGNPVTEQAVLAEFLTTGQYDRQLRRCQRLYRLRRDALVAALAEHLPGARVSGIAAGLHAIVTLPAGYGPQERFLARAAAAGVRLRPLSDYTAGPAPRQAAGDEVDLVVGYAHLAPEAIARAVRLLGAPPAGTTRTHPRSAKPTKR